MVSAHHVSALGLDGCSKMRNEVNVLLAHPKGGLTGRSRYHILYQVWCSEIYTYGGVNPIDCTTTTAQ